MTRKAMERARQSLVGLAVGDAFGETLFGDPYDMARRVATRQPSSRSVWHWTDDTAMALSIVEVLAAHGRIVGDALAGAFVRRWKDEPHRGYGSGAFDLLARVSLGDPWRAAAQQMFGGQGSYGNGAAMRVAPLGAYFADELERACAQALCSAEPTHTHPEGSAGAVAIAAAAALVASGIDRAALLAEVARLTPPGRTRDGLVRAAAFGLDAEPLVVGAELGTGRAAAAHDTVPFAVWVAARHLDSYEDALWTATSQLGDRDTLGAIVGGIVVLATGEEQIPMRWRAATEPLPPV